MEELEALAIVKSIIRGSCDSNKVYYRDTESYLGILYENNNQKWICRIYLNGSNKYITVPDDNKKPTKKKPKEIKMIIGYDAKGKAIRKSFYDGNHQKGYL